jgi:rhamnosyltransferase
MTVWVALRSRDDQPLADQTLAALARQTVPHRLIAFDNASTDGTREAVAARASRLIDVPAGTYVPGRVLNDAMRLTDGPVVVFLNADCTPLHDDWLAHLLAGLDDPAVGAVFGRQVPRPDTHPLHARDTEAAYGDGRRQATWRHCFSMAASAVRRSDWQAAPFDEGLRYSEDIDWTWRLRQRGREVRYVPDAVAAHAHNYTLRQLARRHFGEGEAEARIFEWSDWQASLLRYTVLPWGRQVLADLRWAIAEGEWRAGLEAPVVRVAQSLGRRAGFRSGRAGRARSAR